MANMSKWRIAEISIHAPRAGRDLAPLHDAARKLISIHAPRAGRDGKPLPLPVSLEVFQSTRPVRGATHPQR